MNYKAKAQQTYELAIKLLTKLLSCPKGSFIDQGEANFCTVCQLSHEPVQHVLGW